MATYNLGQVAPVSMGAYNSATTYKPLNIVTDNGGAYMCIMQCVGIEPLVTSGWEAYWVATAVGVSNVVVSAPDDTHATITITLSNGNVYTKTYATTAVPSLGVDTGNIADEAVTNEKIAEEAVDTDQLANGAVTYEKLGDGAVHAINLDPQIDYSAVNLQANQVRPIKFVTEVPTTETLAEGEIAFMYVVPPEPEPEDGGEA